MKVMARAIHMHTDNTKQFNYKYTIYCMHANKKKKIELWCMWGNSCCDFEEGREDMRIDRTNLCISWGSVLLFCSDELLNNWALEEPGLVFDPLTLYWWLVSSALNTYGPLPLIQEIAREVTHTITARGGSIIDLNTKCEGEGCDGLERWTCIY